MTAPKFFQTRMGVRFFEVEVPSAIKAVNRVAAAIERLAEPPGLSRDDLALLVEAIDSHIYWQLADEKYRSNGDVLEPMSDDPEMREQILAATKLHDRLFVLFKQRPE